MKKNSLLSFLLAILLLLDGAAAESVRQSARRIPVAAEVDVVVAGGTVGAVAAASEAARHGASVLLVAPRTYLGEDLAATLRLWLEDGESPAGELTQRIFADLRTTTPMRVKKTLEAALLDSGVDFLLASYVTDVLLGPDGQPAGLVMANRAGRQAVRAGVIVDATGRAVVATLAGAERRPWTPGEHRCRRVVLGGEPTSTAEPGRSVPAGVEGGGHALHYYEYSLELDLGDGSFPALAEAESRARDLTYREGQLRAAEQISFVPPDAIRGRAPAHDAKGDAPTAVDRLRPRNVDRLYVLGPAADVPRAEAARIMRPTVAEPLGRAVGRATAREAGVARTVGHVSDVSGTRESCPTCGSADPRKPPVRPGDVREVLTGLRPTDCDLDRIATAATRVPVLDEVDVLVVGGGTSGACAAIGAARRGADVLVVEYQEGLGGVGTVGLIGRAYHGRNEGFTREVPFCDKEHNNEYKMEWFRREIEEAGGRVWLGVLGCGAFVEGDRAVGAVLATPLGRGVVLADVVVDATGNGDVAVAAGAESMYGGGADDVALQGTGLPLRPLGASYVNTDYLLVDESDMVDTRRALVGSRLAQEPQAYDVGPFIQTRERRRVRGDHVLSYLDQITGRTYPDSIVLSASDYDSHGYPSEPFFALIPHTEKTLKANHPAPGGTCYTPYRCLLPRGLEGMLVTGLAISMHRDAAAMVRMQRDMHNQGYAAGVAAAMAARAECTPRQVDVDRLQRHLVEIGNLPESVLTDGDSHPLPQQAVYAAVERLADESRSRPSRCRALAVVLSHAERARAALRESFASAEGESRLTYAKVLGFLGEHEVVPVLAEALDRVDAWDAKILQGRMAEYAHLPTPVDALILALGYTGDRRATPAVLRKLEMLDADVTLSHHRSVALALEHLADRTAAESLARLLQKPDMHGHAMTQLEPLHDRQRDKRRREGPLREIVLARALYRSGDHDGLAQRILRQYQRDLRGLFARHATAVLEGAPKGEGKMNRGDAETRSDEIERIQDEE